MPLSIEKNVNPVAAALDLGSTRFKLGVLDERGKLGDITTSPTPELTGTGLIREGNAEQYLHCAEELVRSAAKAYGNLPLGIVSQRSSFVVWDRGSGAPLTPMVSWQDRRAADWCQRNADLESRLVESCGLLLSPHYAGPKLAAMLEVDASLGVKLTRGEALFGTLETWLIWNWTRERAFRTDTTMAARTAIFNLDADDWSPALMSQYGLSGAVMPRVGSSDAPLAERLTVGMQLSASIADQGAGAIAVLEDATDGCLVNIGTGAFVLRPINDATLRLPGYLTGPVLATGAAATRYVLEGTINGVGPAIGSFGKGPDELPAVDAHPDAYAIPDQSGLGAPHWRPAIGLTLSTAARQAPEKVQRRICIEGLLFRIYEILLDVYPDSRPGPVLLSGGLASDPSIGQGLASLLDQPVTLLKQSETTLLGAARLAAGRVPFAEPATQLIARTDAGAYLPEKFERWRRWVDSVLD